MRKINFFFTPPKKNGIAEPWWDGENEFLVTKKKSELRNNTEEEAIIDFLPTLFLEFMRFPLLRAGISCREACRTAV